MNDDFTIYPVKPDLEVNSCKREFPDHLPKPPFTMLINGSRGSGKTTLLSALFFKQNCYGEKKNDKVFDRLIIFSSTLGMDSTSRFLVDSAHEVYNNYDDDAIIQLLNFQKRLKKRDRPHILLCLDDIAPMLKKRDTAIWDLFSVHRHYNISIIVLSQNLKLCPPIVRNNAVSMIFYKINSNTELEKIVEEMSFITNKKTILEMYDYATDTPYCFMMCDAVKNKVWKWGCQNPELLYSKYGNDGLFN